MRSQSGLQGTGPGGLPVRSLTKSQGEELETFRFRICSTSSEAGWDEVRVRVRLRVGLRLRIRVRVRVKLRLRLRENLSLKL